MRLRIGIEGKLFGFVPVYWTLVAQDVPKDNISYAMWVCALLHGVPVKGGSVLKGTIFATLS